MTQPFTAPAAPAACVAFPQTVRATLMSLRKIIYEIAPLNYAVLTDRL
ncbi:MAG: hypothetical protein ABF254_11605 [Octadecabacter sp.]